MLMLLQIM